MAFFIINTLGCKVNQYESDLMARSLANHGYQAGDPQKPADLVVINTCTVTQKAANESKRLIRRAVRFHPKARIAVTGCLAQTEPDEVIKISDRCRLIDNDKKDLLVPAIFNTTDRLSSSIAVDRPATRPAQPPVSIREVRNRTRSLLKIQDGCNGWCTYCIVPVARGKSRSMPFKDVLNHIRQLKENGYQEVVLTGIHLGCWGRDLNPRTDLLELLTEVTRQNMIKRVRLSSIEPQEISLDLIKLTAASPIMCRHFHIPLQSGDDHVLKQMGRPYTGAFFKELIQNIHYHIPDAAIGVDVLTGFPGESDGAFERTRALIEKLPVTYLHVFPFSSRKKTKAYDYPDKIDEAVIKQRSRLMRMLGINKKHAFYQKAVGRKVDVLMEGRDKNSPHLLKGLTSNYIPVLVNSRQRIENKIKTVCIESVTKDNRVFGSLASSRSGLNGRCEKKPAV